MNGTDIVIAVTLIILLCLLITACTIEAIFLHECTSNAMTVTEMLICKLD